MPRKRLFFDIETSPNIGMFWSAGFKQRIDYENIIKERAIICICYKWGGEREVSYLTWDKKQNDKKMLQEFIKVANEADELIGHNGDKFDLAWIRTRCLFHRIPMFPDYVTIDTLKVSRAKFRFNSNRLIYIGKLTPGVSTLGVYLYSKPLISIFALMNKAYAMKKSAYQYQDLLHEIFQACYEGSFCILPAHQK